MVTDSAHSPSRKSLDYGLRTGADLAPGNFLVPNLLFIITRHSGNDELHGALPLFYLGDFGAGGWLGCIVTNSPGFKALAISSTFCLTYASSVA